jgi:hypothetical protein
MSSLLFCAISRYGTALWHVLIAGMPSIIGGEQFAANAVVCSGWPIVANEVFTGKQHDTRQKLPKTDGAG